MIGRVSPVPCSDRSCASRVPQVPRLWGPGRARTSTLLGLSRSRSGIRPKVRKHGPWGSRASEAISNLRDLGPPACQVLIRLDCIYDFLL